MLAWFFKSILLFAVVTANAAGFESSNLYGDSNPHSLRIARFNLDSAGNDKPVRLSLRLVPILTANAPFVRGNFGAQYQPIAMTVTTNEAAWMLIPLSTTPTRRGRISLLPMLSLERPGEFLELKPRLRAVSLEWRKTFQ